jgi:RsiW-degrading membrane proteinase PrsW (M82 family)
VFCLLGAFQFLPALRGRRGWHRVAGFILIPAGLVSALSGLWMAAFYTSPDGGSPLLTIIRLAFGSAMAAGIVFGILAIKRRDFVAHGDWMTRAYALGIAAGTQAVVLAIWILSVGPVDTLTDALLLRAAWMINAAVAEFVILRRARPPQTSAVTR